MRISLAALGLVFTACYSTGEGISPPLDRIYFPVGLATDCDSRAGAPTAGELTVCQSQFLYVASSDFDLQFNAGSIQVVDLDQVRKLIPKECQSDADCSTECDAVGLLTQTAADRVTVPGPCRAVQLSHLSVDGKPLLVDSVGTGAFATDVVLTSWQDPDQSAPDGIKKRLLVPLRGEASLNWIDLEPLASSNSDNPPRPDGKLDCGQTPESPICDRRHRVGTDATQNTRGVRMPPEPYGIATSDEGDAIVVTHQVGGALSILSQDLQDRVQWDSGPKLEYVHPLPALAAVAIAAAPEPRFVRQQRKDWLAGGASGPDPYPPGFLVAYANAAQLDLVRYFADGPSSPSRPFAQGAVTVPIRANSQDTVSRGVAFDDTQRRVCDEKNCTDLGSAECNGCVNMPVGVYVSSRSPASLLVGGTIPGTVDVPQFQDVVPLTIGPSRVYVGKVLVEDGTLETRIFVVCFDQRRIVIYDPQRRMIEAYITTGRGPHAMAFDFYAGDATTPARALAYVAHFTDSYLGVIELDRRNIRTFANIVLSIAPAVAPRASK